MNDPLDVDLRDGELENEILLLTDLMVAASQSSGALNEAMIDAVLFSADDSEVSPQIEHPESTATDSQAPTGDLRRRSRPPIIPPPRTPETPLTAIQR